MVGRGRVRIDGGSKRSKREMNTMNNHTPVTVPERSFNFCFKSLTGFCKGTHLTC